MKQTKKNTEMTKTNPGVSRMRTARRQFALLNIAVILAMVFSFFQGIVPGTKPPEPALAHNLQTKMVYMFFDPNTQAMLDARIPTITPPTPLLQVNDELGIIIKVVPRDGTTTGVGGHVDFYVPNGVEVIDVAYLQTGDANPGDGISGYDKISMKGQSLIAVGDGPIGAKATSQLIGLGPVGPSVTGMTQNPVVPATGTHRGTIAGVYGDTGIFYSTDPDTAYGSWTSFTGATDTNCGVAGVLPLGSTGKTITNNSGDVVVPCNKWDAGQLYAWGAKGTTCTQPGCTTAPIVDYGDGRGNAPWGFASGVAGPQSGYAWYFNWNEWRAGGVPTLSADPASAYAQKMRASMGNEDVGPWNRIQYSGSRLSKDQPGLVSTILGIASVDGSTVGRKVTSTNPLPQTLSQTDTTSPKTIRWAVGQLTSMVPEYVWVKIRVKNTASIVNADGCPVFRSDTFGGDAGGSDNGKDHLWRYYEPSITTWNGCLALGKQATRDAVVVGDTFQYKIKLYNAGTIQDYTNVVIRDTLPSGVTFVSAVPAQNSGPNPLVWSNIGATVGDMDGIFERGEYFEATVTVKASGTGILENTVCVDTNTLDQCASDTTFSGSLPLLRQTKVVSATSVAPGNNVQYTLTVENYGSGPTANPVSITERLEPGVTYVSKDSVVVNGATVTATTTVGGTASEPVFTIPASISAGQKLVLKFTALVSATAEPGVYCNSFTTTQNGVPLTTGSLACFSVGGGKIGDTIYRDWNGNGAQDSTDEGVAGVTVTLQTCNSTFTTCTTSKTTVTDANGNYMFEGLAAGDYRVVVSTGVSTPLEGYTLTADPDGIATPSQSNITLADGEQNLQQDFGYKPSGTGSIGDTVWNDNGAGSGTLGDGTQNGTEPGIANATVWLYEDTNGNGSVDPEDALVATQITNGTGYYQFTGLALNLDYIVKVDASDPDIASAVNGAGVLTSSTPLAFAVELTSPDSTSFQDADFGFYRETPASIGDQVFKDNNNNGIFDGGDVGLANVEVILYADLNGNGIADAGEPIVATQSTNGSGVYTFTDVPPGSYVVVVNDQDPDVPDGLVASIQQLGVSVGPGDNRTDIDFPFTQLLAKAVKNITTNQDPGNNANAGDVLEYTLTPSYTGGQLLTEVTVSDVTPEGSTYVGDSDTPEATSEPAGGTAGTVTWNLGTNTPGVPGVQVMCPVVKVLREGEAGVTTKDTYIDQEDGKENLNYGSSVVLSTGNDDQNSSDPTVFGGKDIVSLVQISVPSLPSGSILQSASLQLTVAGDQGTNRQIQIREQLTDYAEGTGNNDVCTGVGNGASWGDTDNADAGRGGPNCTDSWSGGSDSYTSSNFGTTNYGTLDPLLDETTYSATVTSLVSAWLAGTKTNIGFAMIPSGSANNMVTWHSSESATTTKRPTLVLKYLEPSATGTCAVQTDGMVVYDNNNATPVYKTYTGATNTFSSAANAVALSYKLKNMVMVSSPDKDERIFVGVADNATNNVVGEIWNGTAWAKIPQTPTGPAKDANGTLGEASVTTTYSAAVAYELSSGRAMVVWDDNSLTAGNKLRYSIWDGSTWTAAASITAYTGGEPQYMRLAVKPSGNEMVLVVNDAVYDSYALVWDGTAWGNQQALDAGAVAANQPALHVAYENSDGHALVVYGKDSNRSVFYRTWNGTTWSAEASVAPPSGIATDVAKGTPQRLVIANDSSTNRIALGALTQDKDIWFGIWNGSAWGSLVTATTGSQSAVVQNLDVAFESLSGQALAVYGEAKNVRYRTWGGAGWSGELTGSVLSNNTSTLVLRSDPNSDKIMLAALDSGADVYNALWTGSAWNAKITHSTNSGYAVGQPFAYNWRRDQIAKTATKTLLSVTPTFFVDSGSGTTATVTIIIDPGYSGTLNTVPLSSSTTGGVSVGACTRTDSNTLPMALTAGTAVQFTYTCPVTASSNYGSATFTSTPTGTGAGILFTQGASNSILGTPPLKYRVTVTGALNPVRNTASIRSNEQEQLTSNMCYAIADETGSPATDNDALFTWDLTAATTGTIGAGTGTTHSEAAAWNADYSAIYTTNRDATVGAGSDRFGTVNVITGVFTAYTAAQGGACAGRVACATNANTALEGSLGSFTVLDIDGLSFDPATGDLYAVHRRESGTVLDVLLKINPVTGQHVEDAFGAGVDYVVLQTNTLATPLYDVDDIAFHPTTGQLYAVVSDDGATPSHFDRLVTVNKATGAITDVGRITNSSGGNVDDVEGLAFLDAPSGIVLYGTTGNDPTVGPSLWNNLWEINPVTAAATKLATSPTNYGDVEAITCKPGEFVEDPIIPPSDSNEVITYLPAGSIGDFVWMDLNRDGNYDPGLGETPIANAVVLVYRDVNNNGILDPLVDVQVGIDFTDVNGLYSVGNLPAGKYLVDVYEDSLTPDGDGGLVATTPGIQAREITCSGSSCSNYTDADFGYVLGAIVEGTVFHDVNHNGVLDDGATGLTPVTVTISGTDLFGNPVTATVETDANGYYKFVVPPGNYTITYDPLDVTAINSTLTDATTPTSFTFLAEAGEDHHYVYDFGVDNSGKIGDRVWNDGAGGNGTQDVGELGIANVTLRLYLDQDGNLATTGDQTLVASTATSPTGAYQFVGLPDTTGSQAYVVKVDTATLPSGYTATGEGDPGTACGGGCDSQIPTTLTGGATITSIDFGYKPPAGTYPISGRVWDDVDGNGSQNGGELGIQNVSVCLYDSTGLNVVACTTTNATGDYTFPGIANGTYVIKVDTTTLPSTAYYQTGDPDATKDNKTTVTVNGAPIVNQNFGYDQLLGSITGTICDGSGDGFCDDPGETPGPDGVPVFLTYAGKDGILGTPDDVVTSTTTSGGGNYSFTNLAPGIYQVTKTNPAGKISLADADAGNPDNITVSLGYGVDGLPNTGDDRMVAIDRDFELKAIASIGDRVWLDENGDGVQDAGEAGIPNVKVELYASNGTTLLQTTTTDTNGGYLFDDLLPGTYVVKVDPTSFPSGLSGNQTYDPDGTKNHQTTVTVVQGQEWTTADFGYNWSSTCETDTPGTVNCLTPTGAIGDRLWIDADGDGVQDPEELGLQGVTVELWYDSNNDGVVDMIYPTNGTAITNASGNYIFDGLPKGIYEVRVPTTPAGYTQTGDPDGVLDGKTTQPILLAPGDVYVNADFGYAPQDNLPNSLGDTVWLDVDRDGFQDAGEAGIPGVLVQLTWAGPDGNLATTTDNVVYTTLTDEHGNYLFTDLPDGNFQVTTNLPSNTGAGGPLEGLLPAYDSSGSMTDGTSDVSLDPTHASTNPVTNLAQDFGYSPNDGAGNEGLIGDTIFWDANGNNVADPGEGIPGVKVTLDGTIVTYTDANGNYYFGGLASGPHTVVVDITTLPAGLTSSYDPDGGTANQSSVTLAANEVNLNQDFGYTSTADPLPNSLGDTVWLDVNRNSMQDAGEAGIGGVAVQLTWAGPDGNLATTADNVVYTTVTDVNGTYLFTNLPDGNFQVTTNLASNTGAGGPLEGLYSTYDSDVAANGNGTSNVSLDPGKTSADLVTNLAQDFGYSPNDGAGNEGLIGDTVFLDTNGNGKADPGEGLPGVKVTLTDGVTTWTTYTDANGFYNFAGLPAGSFIVTVDTATLPDGGAGLTNTFDPDGGTANQSLVNLAANQIRTDIDFGYQSTTTQFASIGDRVWLDADGDGVQDAGEPGIPGVTVALIRDLDGDGVWDVGEPIIATDITDSNGIYTFNGVSTTDGTGTDDYLVWVNDTANVLDTLEPSYDSNGTLTPDISAVSNLTPAGDLNQDFGYEPLGQIVSRGAIGDTIFLDRDSDNMPDAGEGLEGVKVNLYASNGTTLIGSTFTNENGTYVFGNLPAGTYVVKVDTTTLPGTAGQLTNSYDPDATSPLNESTVILAAGQINLTQDFGYRDQTNPNSISGTIWKDTDSDGYQDPGEPGRYGGVTVVLRDTQGDVVATTTTDANGNYTFSNLPDGTYSVDVTDDANVLDGTWKSVGPTPGADYNSQSDPYSVTVTGGANNTTADFGYYRQPAELGNYVWEDADGDGLQDVGELGLAGVDVTLTVTWPNSGGTTVYKTTTDASGFYNFGNLLLDEDQDGLGSGEPTFNITIASPAGYTPTLANQGTNDALDSDGTSVAATVTMGTANTIYDFGFVRAGSIGNYVWLDEDGDGLQDAGEAGIANVRMYLYAQDGTTLLQTTYTDADGGYVFTNLPAGTYVVKVDTTTMPSGLAANQTYDEDGTGTANQATVTLTSGEEHLTTDFGYNWAPTSDVTGNTGTGAIGDRVWIDDGDGVQELGEPGLAGVTVQLWYDSNNDGTIDLLYPTNGTATTNASGNYIFDGLPAGIYEVRVTAGVGNYTQTGDPDGTLDGKTTQPVVLAPGDVFVNADFGYQPNTDVGATIGDLVWLDADGDGTQDVGENGIPGVTVSLIRDTNADGIWDPDGVDNIYGNSDDEPIIATDTTDANGAYTFTGVPTLNGTGTDDYLVWVNDTNNVLGTLQPSYDSNGVSTPDISAVSNLTPAGDTSQDFGYEPLGQDAGADGVIGDTIFLDRNGSNAPDAGEGLEGVTVWLYRDTNRDGNYDAGEPLLNTAVTNENGTYVFGNLPAGDYVVVVDTGSLPVGVTNSYDPDISNSPLNESGIALTTGQVVLDQDFGYAATAPGSVSGTIWKDTDADGVKDAGETGRYDNVTVVLYDSSGDVVATTTTAPDGTYSFANLPPGSYTVDVTDNNNVLNGTWHSLGTDSKPDPNPVTVTSGNNTVSDFGYYRDPAALGNWVWKDIDRDGIQDGGEVGIPGVVVTLTITWPGGATTSYKTTTNGSGYYSFGNLLLDENFNGDTGDGSTEPTFSISVVTPTSHLLSPSNNPSTTDLLDSDGSPVAASVTEGVVNDTYDFGFYDSTTSVEVFNFKAQFVNGTSVQIEWDTIELGDVSGFNLYRATTVDGTRVLVNATIIPVQIGVSDPHYVFLDQTVSGDNTYYYWLTKLVDPGNTEVMVEIDPAMATQRPYGIFLPFTSR